MTGTVAGSNAVQKTRNRALIIPREHGAWGLLLVPLFSGAAVGLAASPQPWPVLLLTLVALTLFWLRTPVESLLGTTPMSARTAAERQYVFGVSLSLAVAAAACLAGLLWNGHNQELFLIGGIAGLAFVVQTLLIKLGRRLRMTAQLIGALGLTCTAPAAYYVATGRLDNIAFALWAANWIFAGNQIHFVQLRIHACRAVSFREKWAHGLWFLVAQVLLVPLLAMASAWKLAPPLLIFAFLPALARGFYWFFSGAQPLHVRSLGWAEMRQGALFGVLLAAAFILAR